MLFSILIPLIKAVLMIPILARRNSPQSYRLLLVVRSISEWSMADVFAVGVLIARFLVARDGQPLSGRRDGLLLLHGVPAVSNAAFQALHIDRPA